MRILIVLHRWLGVAFCLLFAMWFASGIVMHFVPFPALTEADRFAGMALIDLTNVRHTPAEARAASGVADATRVRLMQRSDGPVYLIASGSHLAALRAADLSGAAVHSEDLALAIASDQARRRGWDARAANIVALNRYDQWTVPGNFDLDRPLYRIALDDEPGTELYVSSTTGETVLTTNRRQRAWNYLGSVAHWIYPTALRAHPAVWNSLVWWISFLAMLGAVMGAVIGPLRIGIDRSRLVSPYRGWQALHHWMGLACGLFVLTWIFSGWLSMDNGTLFSTGTPSEADRAAIVGTPPWDAVSSGTAQALSAEDREVEWFAFDGRIYRRERTGLDHQRLYLADAPDAGASEDRQLLHAEEIDNAARRLGRPCDPALAVPPGDAHAVAASTPDAPVFRVICGDDWYDIDGSDGALMQKLGASRRAYRWLYAGLHTFDFPGLAARPMLRSALIVGLCGVGFLFSLTAIVIAGRRLLSCFRRPQ
jgi:hypothetical protein